MQGDAKHRLFIYALLLSMIASGALNTIVYKWQNSTEVAGGGLFYHPFMQATAMFLGEAICIILYLGEKKRNQYDHELEKIEAVKNNLSVSNIKYFWLAIPASADFFTSTLQYIALNFLNPSVYQMLRGGVIVITAIFSVMFLKRKL